jgi:FIMAH domain-containing protein
MELAEHKKESFMKTVNPLLTCNLQALVLMLALAVFPSPSFANVSSMDDPEFGVDSLTFDSDTNLAWLDLTHTVGRSYDDVASKLGAGQEFEGFRYATENEVLSFFLNAGIPQVPGSATPNIAPITDLQMLIGTTLTGLSQATTGTPWSASHMVTAYLQLSGNNGVVGFSSTTRNSVNGSAGGWLVKTITPALLEPAEDPVFGPDSLTLDTTTNLLWLDLEYTDERSYLDVSSKLGAGGEFEGFRYATQAEVLAFFSAAGIPDVPGTSAANVEPIGFLHGLVGTTDNSNSFSLGITGTPHPYIPDSHVTMYAYLNGGTGEVASSSTNTVNGQINYASGNWLVKPAVAPSDVDDDGVPDTEDSCPSDPEDACDPTGSAAEEIPFEEGGTVSTPDGQLTLEVDPGDLKGDETLSITEIVDDPELADVVITDGSVAPLALYVLEPDGTQFDQTVTLNINLDVTALTQEERDNLDIYLHEDTDGVNGPDTFVPQFATCVVTEDPVGIFTAACTLELAHFSTYAVLIPKDSDGDGIFDDFGGIEDACLEEDSTGFDADADGCVDTITGLTDLVSSLVSVDVIDSKMENSLLSKLANVQKSQDKENVCAMIDQLTSFNSQVAAQTGKKISPEASATVTAYASSVIAFISHALPEGESCE